MARIQGQEEQQRALKEIKKLLKDLVGVNQFLAGSNSTGNYSVSYTDNQGKSYIADLYCEDKADIDLLVIENKNRIKDHIIKLASDNRIALDDDDNAILGIVDEEAASSTEQNM